MIINYKRVQNNYNSILNKLFILCQIYILTFIIALKVGTIIMNFKYDVVRRTLMSCTFDADDLICFKVIINCDTNLRIKS